MKITIRRAKKKRHGRHRWIVTEILDPKNGREFIYAYTAPSFNAARRIAIGILTDGKVFVEDIIDVSAIGSRRWGR